jgi:hypothetical protein
MAATTGRSMGTSAPIADGRRSSTLREGLI